MHADPFFFDTSYLVRLYLEDPGFEEVRALTRESRTIATSWHAQAEVVAALHRGYRERRMDHRAFQTVVEQFNNDSKAGLFVWLPLVDAIQRRVNECFVNAPASVFLRGADALHLACAAEHGFDDVYSNDRHFLAAAPLFGLRGVNVIGSLGLKEKRATYRATRKTRA